MARQTYLGLEGDGNLWILAQHTDGQGVFYQRFGNTVEGLSSLAKFIHQCCDRPRICLKSSNHSIFALLKYLSDIPEAEVILVSEVGFQQYHKRLPETRPRPSSKNLFRAELLARCAKRMI